MEKFQIGYMIIKEEREFRNTYECAAWYQTVKVPAGKYPLTASEYRKPKEGKRNQIDIDGVSACLTGEIVGSDFTSHFAGNAFGKGQIDKDKGEVGVKIYSAYAHSIAENIIDGKGDFELLPEFEAREVAFLYNGQPRTTHGIFKK